MELLACATALIQAAVQAVVPSCSGVSSGGCHLLKQWGGDCAYQAGNRSLMGPGSYEFLKLQSICLV